MKVRCTGGLNDRIRMMFSYVEAAKRNNEILLVNDTNPNYGSGEYGDEKSEWSYGESQYSGGFFLDLFEPIKNVRFTNVDEDGKEIGEGNWDNYWWETHPDFDPHLIFVFSDLKPISDIVDEIDKLRSEMNDDYVAIHVRSQHHACCNIPNSDYFDFVEKNDNDSRKKIFLATDTYDSQKAFKKKYGKRLVCSSEITPCHLDSRQPGSNEHLLQTNQTSVKLTVIDMFTCIEAAKFQGCRASGLTRTIQAFHEHRDGTMKAPISLNSLPML